MEAKKISFGFSKIKKPNLAGPSAIGSQKSKDGDKVELISCLEGQAIKIVGKENDEAGPPPLVIPLREQDKTTIPDRLAKLQDIIEGREGDQNGVNKDVEVKPVPVGNESLEQRAAREILEDLQERKSRASEKDSMVVPLKPEDLPLDGGRESTMNDYESVPIEKFGLAMLRGMGWKEDPNAPKKSDKFPEGPVQRPKGMGLGAERAPKDKSRQLIPPAKDEVLVMKNGAFVKVLAGKHKETYGTRGVPTGVVLLDWQICRYVSPALDLLYFIFGCTDEAFRRQHYDEMIRIYYDSLKQLLEKLGGDPSRQFPYTALLRQLKACGKFGILMAMFMVPMLCIDNQDLPDMDQLAEKHIDSQEFDASFIHDVKSEDKYKTRMAAVIRDLIRYGYL